jgi:beta-galactosidase/beta-glucuronidase
MNTPRPEHPRPQLTRERWLSLNGIWEFDFDPGLSGIARGLPAADHLAREILVPFCPESSLSGIGDIDFHPGVWYRRTFRLPDAWAEGRVLLHVGAADHDAWVWINGHEAGWHRGGFTPFEMDITPLLHAGENTVVIHARDDTRSPLQAGGKQCPDYLSRGCHYTRTTGIWQTVWIEHVPDDHIASLRLTPHLESGMVLIEAQLAGSGAHGELIARVTLGGQRVAEGSTRYIGQRAALMIPIADCQAWSPAQPTLYDLQLELRTSAGDVDRVQSYFGMRSVSLSGPAILLNGAPLFQRLVLDQGFYPDGIYTASTDDALREDIRMSQAMGFNGARLHQKVFEPRFLYWADRLGYLVWGEFPSWGLDVQRAKALTVVLPQWLEVLRRDHSSPSIIGWCPLNETKREQDPEVVRNFYRVTKAVDPTRPVIDTSGYVHVETDIYDVHSYQQDPATFAAQFAPLASGGEPFRNRPEIDAPYQGQPYFVSEYGGIWWNPGQSDGKAWGYGGDAARPKSEAEFLARYRALTETLLRHPRMCAFCYTQLYDVEQEVNGLYTYQRQAKFDPALIREINAQPAAIER